MRIDRVDLLDGRVTLYRGNCQDLVGDLIALGAIVTDPPYGMKWDTNTARFSGGDPRINRGEGRKDWGEIVGDSEPFNPVPWLTAREVVLWGANHYASRLPVGKTLVWLKKPYELFGTFLSDAEIGWASGGHGVFAHYRQFPPPTRALENGVDGPAHPTQKPVGLMSWCIDKFTRSHVIVDPYMGSGTTGVAAVRMGRRFVGCEISPRFFDVAVRRIGAAASQPDLFGGLRPPPVQESLL